MRRVNVDRMRRYRARTNSQGLYERTRERLGVRHVVWGSGVYSMWNLGLVSEAQRWELWEQQMERSGHLCARDVAEAWVRRGLEPWQARVLVADAVSAGGSLPPLPL